MIFNSPNSFIYFALGGGLIFTAYSFFKLKKIPNLTEFFSAVLAVAAGYSGIELCIQVLEGSKKLGDFSESKLVIILGGIAVTWIAISNIFGLLKQEENS